VEQNCPKINTYFQFTWWKNFGWKISFYCNIVCKNIVCDVGLTKVFKTTEPSKKSSETYFRVLWRSNRSSVWVFNLYRWPTIYANTKIMFRSAKGAKFMHALRGCSNNTWHSRRGVRESVTKCQGWGWHFFPKILTDIFVFWHAFVVIEK